MKPRLLIAALACAALACAGEKPECWAERVPPQYRARQNPYEGQAEAAGAGAKLFRQHCAQCHGEDARGTRRAPGLHSPTVRVATPGTLFWVLRNGIIRRGMPSWTSLAEPQRWQIVTYLKALARSAETAGPRRCAAPPPGRPN